MSKSRLDKLRLALILSEETGFRYRSGLSPLIDALHRQGIAVCVVGGGEVWESDVLPEDVEPIVIPFPEADVPGTQWLQRRHLLAKLRAFTPSILHALGEDSAGLVRYLARQLDLPYALNMNREPHPDQRLPISSLRCAGLLAPSPGIHRRLIQRYTHFHGRIAWAPLVIPVGDQPVTYSHSDHRICVAVGCGSQTAQTLRPLLQAIQALIQQRYRFLTVLIGPSPGEHELRHMIKAMKLDEDVTWISDGRPWRPILSAADIYVHMNGVAIYDPLCQEAMGVGLAVLTGGGGCEDFLWDGHTCLRFKRTDPTSLQTVLKTLLDDPHVARRMAEGAQTALRSQGSLDRMMRAYLGMYEWVQSWSYGLETIPA